MRPELRCYAIPSVKVDDWQKSRFKGGLVLWTPLVREAIVVVVLVWTSIVEDLAVRYHRAGKVKVVFGAETLVPLP
jgi:hypothetical protein